MIRESVMREGLSLPKKLRIARIYLDFSDKSPRSCKSFIERINIDPQPDYPRQYQPKNQPVNG